MADISWLPDVAGARGEGNSPNEGSEIHVVEDGEPAAQPPEEFI